MSEEEDYMSDKFISSEIRPSLIHSRIAKKQIEVANGKALHNQKQRDEHLQSSLERPIEESNKGYQLMTKMGYSKGQSLGKVAKARIEPIEIHIKTDRAGLGRANAMRESRKRRLIVSETFTLDYQKRVAQRAEERLVETALRQCQLTCETLDIQSGLSIPVILWFWPERPSEHLNEDNDHPAKEKTDFDEIDDKVFSNTEKLEMLTHYLRTTYMFCMWCGVRFKDNDDLNSCPGITRDEH